MKMPPIVSPEEWKAAREALLGKEKEYRFEGTNGPASLLDLFEGRRQLIVDRFFDFDVDQWHGTNAFYREDDDRVYRTYFIDNRGDEALGSTWSYLDMTALGRQEEWEDSPEGYPQTPPYQWWNYHDAYGHG